MHYSRLPSSPCHVPSLPNNRDPQIDHVWWRVAMAGPEGMAHLTVANAGSPVATPVAAGAKPHPSFDDHGVIKMRPMAALLIEPGKLVKLSPGGHHIMLMGLKQPLKQGNIFQVTLSFATAGQMTATVTVEKAGVPMPRMDQDHIDGMGIAPMQSGGKPRAIAFGMLQADLRPMNASYALSWPPKPENWALEKLFECQKIQMRLPWREAALMVLKHQDDGRAPPTRSCLLRDVLVAAWTDSA